jgi:hypothetical protein
MPDARTAALEPLAAEHVSMEAARLPIPEIAAFMREHLGQRLTAYLSGLNDPKMVTRWIAGQSTPRDYAQRRLREGYQAARLVVSVYGDETAKAWFFGSNTRLDDEAPAYLLRHAKSWEDLRPIVPAARVFVGMETSK